MNVSAYCYMPDHLHLLVAGQSPASDGKAFIAKSKQLSGYAFRRETKEQLWQRYAYDRLVTPYTVHDVVRYILANPVVAGMVSLPLDYPYSGSEVWNREELANLMEGYPKPPQGQGGRGGRW